MEDRRWLLAEPDESETDPNGPRAHVNETIKVADDALAEAGTELTAAREKIAKAEKKYDKRRRDHAAKAKS